MTDFESDEFREQMLEELIAASRPKTRGDYPQPNITAQEMADKEKTTRDKLKNRLDKAVRDGVYGSAKVNIDGKKTNIYWLKSHETKKVPTP